MAGKQVTLRGDLDGVVIELSAARKITRVVKNGKLMECETTEFGTFCHVVGAPVPGPGTGPALQLRVTPKSLFARAVPDGGVGLQRALRTGFQRHRV